MVKASFKKLSHFSKMKKQAGNVMVEYGFYMVLAAIAIGGIVTYFASNSTAEQAQQLTADLTTMFGRVKGGYANNYAIINNAKLDSGGFFKNLPSLNNVAGVVTTSLGGGTLTVTPGTVTVAGDSVQYVVTQIPDAGCLPVVTSLVKNATRLLIGANVVKEVGSLPDPSKIICAGDANTMTVISQ
ncbi:MAG: type 4 pilus major pilin [bacterium]|nr:type 4 pilus major pilin [bacterium]